jgi:N-acetylglucosamine-6-phosphate deacetylase
MIIGNAVVFTNGKFTPGAVEVIDGKIAAVGDISGPFDVDAGGNYLIPGFVDIHTHGAVGADFSDGDPNAMVALSHYYARNGITSFLATTMTLKEQELLPAMYTVRDFLRPEKGAKCAGVHLEGPFLSPGKRGAQALGNLHNPDVEMFNRLNEASGDRVRLVTVAPELEGAIDFIEQVSKICTVSLGHTEADYDTAADAFRAGASHVTHLFNCMPSLHHRAPGLIGAAMDSGATAELICDGLHVHPSVVRAAHKLFADKLVVISDSLRCAGMPDGAYELGGQPIEVHNGRATLAGTDTLAGSSANLLEEVRNLLQYGISLADALTAVTYAPAKAVGLEKEIGSIAEGLQADFLLLTPELELKSVYIDGEKIH